jgi:hypothetical protein
MTRALVNKQDFSCAEVKQPQRHVEIADQDVDHALSTAAHEAEATRFPNLDRER